MAENQLAAVLDKSSVGKANKEILVAAFGPLQSEAVALIESAEGIAVTDATQVTEMRQAREKRLELRTVRIAVEENRKKYGDDSLRMTQAINLVARTIKGQIEPVEARLEEAEQFAIRAEAARKAATRAKRADELRPYVENCDLYRLEDMSEEQYADLLGSSSAAHQTRLDLEWLAEEDRRAAEKAQEAEAERIREENSRLREQNAAAEAAATADRQARLKAEDALRATQEAEARLRAAAAKAQRAAALAPDREKILFYADLLLAVPFPLLSDPATGVSSDISAKRVAFVRWVRQQADALDS